MDVVIRLVTKGDLRNKCTDVNGNPLKDGKAYTMKVVIGADYIESQDEHGNKVPQPLTVRTTGGRKDMNTTKNLTEQTMGESTTEYEEVVVPGPETFALDIDYADHLTDSMGKEWTQCFKGEWCIESVTFEETDMPEGAWDWELVPKNGEYNVSGTPWTLKAQYDEESLLGGIDYRFPEGGDRSTPGGTEFRLTGTVGEPEKDKDGNRITKAKDRWWWVYATLQDYAPSEALVKNQEYTGSITVNSSKATGEDCFLFYKTKKNAKTGKKAIVRKTVMKNGTKFTITHKKLKNQKTLFVRVRTVVKSQGQQIYGVWSAVRKITVKK